MNKKFIIKMVMFAICIAFTALLWTSNQEHFPDEALHIDPLKDPQSATVIRKIAKGAAPHNYGLVYDYISARDQGKQGFYFNKMFEIVADKDPVYAAKLVAMMDYETSLYPRLYLAKSWSKKDPMAAIEWVLSVCSNYEDSLDRQFLLAVVPQLIPDSLEYAEHFALQINADIPRRATLNMIAEARAKQNTETALEWLKTLPEKDQTAPFKQIMMKHIKKDPIDAAARLEMVEETPDKAVLSLMLSHELTKTDLNKALRWAENQDEALRGELIENVVSEWATETPEDALRYTLDNLQGDPASQEMISMHIIGQWSATDPYRTADMLNLLPLNLKRKNFVLLYESWLQADPEGLQNWVTSGGYQEDS